MNLLTLTLNNLILRSFGNGVYNLTNSLEQYQVYCHMTEIPGCGHGGWTLVMKIDGTKVSGIQDIENILHSWEEI